MVSINVHVGRQKGEPQGRNNKVNIVTLDLNQRANMTIATTQGPFWEAKLQVQCHRCMGRGHTWQNCPTSLNFKWGKKEEALLHQSWRATMPPGTIEHNPRTQDSRNQNPTDC